LLKNEEIIAIFPEGTRNNTEAPFLPFKKGVFLIAKHTKAPLVPLVITNSGALWPRGALLPKPGLIKLAIGPPLDLPEGANIKTIVQTAEETMENLYQSLETHP
ncbi:MAG: 1-acyl-sn-glycerol-3-phosphate acyltransferase, partial [Deltaproteobacteria bacterium]|nr:1-acyl-sn-glycerol-3-phosphate acyltransferase [Deltaproteobacteria bacterium]